jgi:glucose-1-phosphatase
MLTALKNKYRLFLFSNTNLVHYESFMASFQQQFGAGHFHDFFEKAYYSHEMNYRKPDPQSFLFITKDSNLIPGETLFIDDTLKNIDGAKEAGLQTLWLRSGMFIEEELQSLINAETSL